MKDKQTNKKPMWVGVEIPNSWGYYKLCIGIDQENGHEVSYFSEADLEHYKTQSDNYKEDGPWIYEGDLVVRYGEDEKVFDHNHELIKDN